MRVMVIILGECLNIANNHAETFAFYVSFPEKSSVLIC
jgi:hypothetical protein